MADLVKRVPHDHTNAHLLLVEIEVCFLLCLEHGSLLLLIVTGQFPRPGNKIMTMAVT